MNMGIDCPFEPTLEMSDEELEELYRLEQQRRAVEDMLWGEAEYGDGNIDIGLSDEEFVMSNLWGWFQSH